MKMYLFFFLFWIFCNSPLFCQTGSITNIAVSQRTDGNGFVDIYYDLTGPGNSYFISMEVSFDNGNTFTVVSPTFLSGNVGSVSLGNNLHILWNGNGSNNNIYSIQTKVKLISSINGPCGQPYTDSRDGKTYNTVQIGTQCWMQNNMNYQIGNSWCYDNNPSNCDLYGRLYVWQSAIVVCPSDWHLPSDDEWTTLTTFLGGESVAGRKMKSTNGWYNNGNGTNSSGFTALPGGSYLYIGSFWYLANQATFWSSTEFSSTQAWYRGLYYFMDEVDRWCYSTISYGYSVRCLKN